jgi:flagellar motor protein MotB
VFAHVRFAFDRSVLDMTAQDALDREVVVRFGEFGNLRFININGYADRIGSVQYNQKLSLRRADAVKAYLVRQGADAEQDRDHGLRQDVRRLDAAGRAVRAEGPQGAHRLPRAEPPRRDRGAGHGPLGAATAPARGPA